MDMQSMMDMMFAEDRNIRSKYHVTLGEAIEILEGFPPNYVTNLNNAAYSYRGYYSDLALDFGESTVEEVLTTMKNVIGNKLTGYKGGEFLMDKDTPLWRASFGDTGYAIVDIRYCAADGVVDFMFKDVD